jgi:hypothetical protein
MSRFSLVASNLRSRIIRESVTGGGGVRTIGRPALSDIVSNLFRDGAKVILKVGGSILGFLGFLGFSFTRLVGVLISGINFLWNFNWNITDDSLDAQLNQLLLTITGQLGGTVGNLIGYSVCGVVPAAGLAVINKQLAYFILEQVGEELLDEFADNLRLLVYQSLDLFISYALNSAFKNTRRWIKQQTKNPDSAISIVGKQVFGDKFDDMVKAWGKEFKTLEFCKCF